MFMRLRNAHPWRSWDFAFAHIFRRASPMQSSLGIDVVRATEKRRKYAVLGMRN